MTAGLGGTPPAPPGYQVPDLPSTAAGSANIFRGRLVIVFGPAGTVTGVFVYAAGTTPALGNPPIFWATSATSDPFGNAVTPVAGMGSPAGPHVTFDANGVEILYDGGPTARILIDPGNRVIEFYDASGTGANPPLTAISAAAGNDRYTGAAFPAGFYGQQLTLANQASAPPAFTGASQYYSTSRGRPAFESSAGDISILERGTTDVTQYNLGNSTTFTRLSGVLNYQAGEGAQSSEYEIEIFGSGRNGTASSQLWTYALFADGLNTGAQFSVGGAAFVQNTPFDYWIRFLLILQGSGVGGTGHISAVGNLAANNANRAPAISVVGLANLDAWPIDTTVSHQLIIMGQFGALIAGQTMTTFRSAMTRRN